MTAQEAVQELKSSQEFFERSSRVLTEEDSAFAPKEGMYTVSQQVSHAARTIDWFVEGASRPAGFDMNFEQHVAESNAITSLTEARKWLDRAYSQAIDYFGKQEDEDMKRPLPAGPIMGGAPMWNVVAAIAEHTAHHRGALTVYARLVGKTPLMPYMDM